jgi:hypothetical protein
MPKFTRRLTVRLPEDDLAFLLQVMERHRCSAALIVREMIRFHREKQG